MPTYHPIPEPPIDPDDTQPCTPPDVQYSMAFEETPDAFLLELSQRLSAVEAAAAAFALNGVQFDWREALRFCRDQALAELCLRGERPNNS